VIQNGSVADQGAGGKDGDCGQAGTEPATRHEELPARWMERDHHPHTSKNEQCRHDVLVVLRKGAGDEKGERRKGGLLHGGDLPLAPGFDRKRNPSSEPENLPVDLAGRKRPLNAAGSVSGTASPSPSA